MLSHSLLVLLAAGTAAQNTPNCSSLPQHANPTCYDDDQGCVCLCESPVLGPCALCDTCDCCTPDVPLPPTPAAELAAWARLFDATGGPNWESCADARHDPCGKCAASATRACRRSPTCRTYRKGRGRV